MTHIIVRTGPRLHKAQKTVLAGSRQFNVVCMGRRFGKSELGIHVIARDERGVIAGYPVAWIAPVYSLLTEAYDAIADRLSRIIKRRSRSEKRIELLTGGKIDFWSMDSENVALGRKYSIVIFDEAATAKKLQHHWEKCVLPTLADYSGRAFFFSTPRGKNYFHKLFQEGKEDPNWASFQRPSTDNPFIDHNYVKMMKEKLPDIVFRQEFLAEFVDSAGGLMRPGFIQEVGSVPDFFPVTVGVDLAISQKTNADYTAAAAIAMGTKGETYVIGVERMRGSFAEILSFIKSFAEKHKPRAVLIEDVQFQRAAIQELLRSTKLPVFGIKPIADKVTRFMPLQARYEHGMVFHKKGLPKFFTDELLAFPLDEHDDCVDALAYAFSGAKQGSTSGFTGINRNYRHFIGVDDD
jgi:predicted phage terminase large subunit-like protein